METHPVERLRVLASEEGGGVSDVSIRGGGCSGLASQ